MLVFPRFDFKNFGLESSGRIVGRISQNFRQKRFGGFRAMTKLHPCIETLNSIFSENPCAKMQKMQKSEKTIGFTVKNFKKEQKPL